MGFLCSSLKKERRRQNIKDSSMQYCDCSHQMKENIADVPGATEEVT